MNGLKAYFTVSTSDKCPDKVNNCSTDNKKIIFSMPILRSPIGCFIVALAIISATVSIILTSYNQPTSSLSQNTDTSDQQTAIGFTQDPTQTAEAYAEITDGDLTLSGEEGLDTTANYAPEEAAVIDNSAPSVPQDETISYKIKRGDNLATIFKKNSLEPIDLHLFNRSREAKRFARRLQPGKQIEIEIKNNQWHALRYKNNLSSSDVAYRGNGELRIITELVQLKSKRRLVEGVIESSLYETAKAANMPSTVILKLSDLFVRDVNFNALRSGDRFKVLLDDHLNEEGKTVRTEVVVAELVHVNKAHRAFRYNHADGRTAYYDEEGENRSYTLMRNPVKNSRVTSYFSYRRLHPILKIRRPHLGIDIAAPSGSPIQAAGDGLVTYVGYKKGYGRTVIIKHDSKYKTLYAHLKSYRRGLKKGSTVKQGQTVAYLGSSGLSTGPHLHYEIRLFNKPQNPLKVRLPTADPLKGQALAEFQQLRPQLEAELLGQPTSQVEKLANDTAENESTL